MSIYWPETQKSSDFISPSRIVAGNGSAAEAGKLIAEQLGTSTGTILVAADDIVLKNGLAEGLLNGLKEVGFEVYLSNGFGSEPSSEVIDREAAKAREAKAQAVIGIGGGSVLDSSKLLALLIRNEGQVADWIGPVAAAIDVAPLLLIPTTCGTGSEATRIAMVTVNGFKRAASCAKFVPAVAIIDPELVASLPGFVVASTAMDALAHAVESLMSTIRSPMSAHSALHAIELLVQNIELATKGDKEALGVCLWASHLAGQALNAGVVLGHSLAYCVSYEKSMPHGTSCALALPYTMAYNQNLGKELESSLARALTGGKSDSLKVAAVAVFDLVKRLGLPSTLNEAEVPVGTEAHIVNRIITEHPRPTNPRQFSEEHLLTLVNAMRNGELEDLFDTLAH